MKRSDNAPQAKSKKRAGAEAIVAGKLTTHAQAVLNRQLGDAVPPPPPSAVELELSAIRKALVDNGVLTGSQIDDAFSAIVDGLE